MDGLDLAFHSTLTIEDKEVNGWAQQLLPGIPDEICLHHITPKLSFKALRVLSAVSCAWLHAIQTRQVYDARLCAHATETFVLIKYDTLRGVNGISLYSLRDNLSFELPPIPLFQIGHLLPIECVLLDGKVYLFGGVTVREGPINYQAVFVLDLVGRWQWEQCASWNRERHNFACATVNGDIYALGGRAWYEPVCDSALYDPKKDKWFYMGPMPSQRFYHNAITLGEKIFVYGGRFYEPEYFKLLQEGSISLDKEYNYVEDAKSLEVYCPATGEWRLVDEFWRAVTWDTEAIFVAQGKFHVASAVGISVYDMERKSWTDLHSHSFDAPEGSEPFLLRAAVAVGDELLAVMEVKYLGSSGLHWGTFLARSRGFGSANTMIGWEIVEGSLSFWPDHSLDFAMHSLQL